MEVTNGMRYAPQIGNKSKEVKVRCKLANAFRPLASAPECGRRHLELL